MEESNSWSEWTGKRSEETAETLRKLRAQADESLNARRRHLSDMETELNHRIQQVAAELAHDLVETRGSAEKISQEERLAQIAGLTAQIEQEAHQQGQLQEELTALQQEKAHQQGQLQEELTALQQELSALQQQEAHQQGQLQEELTALQQEKVQLQEQLQTQIDQQQQLLEQLTAQSSSLEHLEQQQGETSEQMQAIAGQRDQACQALSELQSAAPAELAAEQQQLAELRERFEMAMDDVRQLKKENGELQASMETFQVGRSAVQDEGPLDWQAQKARLLASLAEEEGELLSENRQQERTTIADTVSITDRIMADKDQEIVELRQQLVALPADFAGGSQPVEGPAEQMPQETSLAEDEIIQRERDRLEQLRQEWEEKLRQAELEISIERATLARERSALEEKLTTVQKVPAEEQKSSDQQRPRRRWLAALGIQGEGEEA